PGRTRALVRDDALGAVGAADDQPEFADDDDRRRRLPDQHARRLRRRECAVSDVARRGRVRRVALPAPRVKEHGMSAAAEGRTEGRVAARLTEADVSAFPAHEQYKEADQ